MSRQQFKTAILDHEAYTGKRNLLARRLFNIMLQGGGGDLQKLSAAIAKALTSNNLQQLVNVFLTVTNLQKRVGIMNTAIKGEDYNRLVEELGALIVEHVSLVDSKSHPWLALMIQWAPFMVQKLVLTQVWSTLKNQAHTFPDEMQKYLTSMANKISTSTLQGQEAPDLKWYSLAAELQDDKSNQFSGTVHTQASKTQLRQIANQRNEISKEISKEILQSQLTDQGKEKLKSFDTLSNMAQLTKFGQLRRKLTATDVVDVGHWSQTEPAVKFIQDQIEWLGYREDKTWKLDPTWNSKDPKSGTQFTRIEMGRWINGIFESTAQCTIEEDKAWAWESNLQGYLTRVPLYPLRSWHDLILSLQQGGGTEQEKALWKVQLKSQLTKSEQQQKVDKAKDWAKLRRELQSEDMDFTFAEPDDSQVDIVPAIQLRGKVEDSIKEWLFYKDGQSWKLDTTWGEQELPTHATTVSAIVKGSMRDWFWQDNEKLELAELDVDTCWLKKESLSAYVNRMQTLLQAPAQTQAPSGDKMAEQNEKMMKDKMKILQLLSKLLQ